MSWTIMPIATLLLLPLISSTFAEEAHLKNARQKRQMTSGINCTPQTVTNGMVNYLQTNPSSLYAQGTTAILQCNSGYTPSGTTSSICTNGMWSPALASCMQGGFTGFPTSTGFGLQSGATCMPLIAPLNSRLQYSTNSLTGPYPSGSSVQMLCNSGYVATGSQSSTCQSGVWNPAFLGSCTNAGFGSTTTGFLGGSSTGGVQCSAAITPLNGQIQYNGIPSSGLYSSGSSATLICNAGTYVSGTSTSFCNNGLWTPAFGYCTSSPTGMTGSTSIGFGTGTQCPFPMIAPLGGTVSYSTGSTSGPYSEGTSATLMCSSGTPTGTTVAVCQSGQWQPSFFTGCSNTNAFGTSGFGTNLGSTYSVGQCVAPISSVLGGTVTYSQGGQFGPFPQGTFATLQCQNGQLPSGSSSASCTNGFWSPATLGPCGSNFLGSTAAGIGTGISNGLNNFANGLSSSLNNLQTTCMIGLLPPLNGRITYSNAATFGPFPAGTTATLVCNAGFTPSGQTSASCMNGVFNPSSLGTCNASPGYSPPMMNSFGSNTTALADSSYCYDLPAVQNGTITYSPAGRAPYALGSLATLTCSQGLVAAFASCSRIGWSPSQLTGCSTEGFGSG